MPPVFGIQAPKCARCEKSVYIAEQVIGPSSLPYHKACLKCVACDKRLDSTLLLEHEGKPFCKNCHKAHLGTGKGNFSTAVPLNPSIPNRSSPDSPSTKRASSSASASASASADPVHSTSDQTTSNRPSHSSKPSWSKTRIGSDEIERDHLDLRDETPLIRVTARAGGTANGDATQTSPSTATSNRNQNSVDSPSTPLKPSDLSSSKPTKSDHTIEKSVRSLDDAVSGSSEMPRIVPRSSISSNEVEEAINGKSNDSSHSKTGLEEEIKEEDIGWDEDFREREREKRRLERERQALYSRPENLPSSQGKPKSVKAGSNEYRQSLGSNAQHSPISFPQEKPSFPSSSIGSISLNSPGSSFSGNDERRSKDGLPEPKRPNLPGASHAAKVASPAPLSRAPVSGVSADQITSGIGKLGLGSSIAAAAGGTPLCARCEKAVYFAEQKTAAGRKWHRACLRCDSCSTTLEAGKLEEGPPSAADAAAVKRMRGGDDSNVFCRTCYAKFFGPRGIGNAGMSYPNKIGGH